MYVKFCAATQDGQFVPGFAIEVRNVCIQGAGESSINLDLKHMDGESERVTIAVNYDMSVGQDKLERLMSFHIVEYPDCKIISKDELRAIVGPTGIIDHARNRVIPRS